MVVRLLLFYYKAAQNKIKAVMDMGLVAWGRRNQGLSCHLGVLTPVCNGISQAPISELFHLILISDYTTIKRFCLCLQPCDHPLGKC